MKPDFVSQMTEFEIRKCTRNCNCKVCDKDVKDKNIVYLRSFRLHAQPFHICFDCWKNINLLVNQYEAEAAL